MTRIPSIPADQFDDAQQALFDNITGGARAQLRPKSEFLNSEGGLGGPFGPWIHSPTLGDPAQNLGSAVRFNNRLSPMLRELAILVMGAHAKAEYEWWAHSKIARTEGLPESVLQSLATGVTPDFGDDLDAAAVFAGARDLTTAHNISDASYALLTARFDHATIVDLVITVGYYGMVSMCLNSFQIALPPGEEPVFTAKS